MTVLNSLTLINIKTYKMKNFKLLLVSTFLISFVSLNSQELKYENLQTDSRPKGKFKSYVTKDGEVFNVGDEISFGQPSGTNGKFVFISKMDLAGTVYKVGQEAVNTKTTIKKIYTGGTKRSGFKASFQCKGYTGVDNYFFFIEDAIQSGEIKSSIMSSDRALEELKKAKDKLDLEIITQEEYNKIKDELKQFIK